MSTKNIEDFYPLSPMQQGMLFHSLYAPESGVYVEQLSCTLRGDLDVLAFERAWQRTVERHPILRTAFVGEGLKEPVQLVHRRVTLSLKQQDWRGLDRAGQKARLQTFLQTERRRGFKLSAPPLMRLALMRTAEQTHDFVWTHHHILLDGWSLPLLLQEVFALYETLRRSQDISLEPPRPYRDYIVWLKQQNLAEAETFWQKTLQGFAAPTPLVVDRGLDGQDEQYADQEIRLPANETAELRALARQHQLTLNTLVQGAWSLLLSRYSGEKDVVFGATVSGRPPDLPGSEFMIGLFINTLPVRVRVPPGEPLLSWLKQLQAHQVELRGYEYSPLVQIQGWSDVPRDQPLFKSILVFENYPTSTSVQTHEASLEIQDIHSIEQTNFPLTIVAGAEKEMLLRIVYDTHLFEDDTIGRMLGHLQTLLQGMAANPERRLSELPLLTQTERQQLLTAWNTTRAEYPHDRCAHELFEAQVERTPDAIAVILQQDHLTYRDLNRRANQLAHYLQKLGVGPETLVGICVDRSLEMIVGLLGVLKAGGAYVPLDPIYPWERLAFILKDTQMPVLLTQDRLAAKLIRNPKPKTQKHHLIRLDANWTDIARESDKNPIGGVTPDNLAYVIYTSGSTGRPKGTLLRHRGLCNLAHASIPIFKVGTDSRLLQFASFSFDASVADIFIALLAGATLCLARQETLLPGTDLPQLLRDQGITTVTFPPSVFKVLPSEKQRSLWTIVSAGESCSPDIVAHWAPGRRFLNGYGPTETSVAASYYLAPDGAEKMATVPIGRPIANTQIYLLDAQLQPAPVGVPGELHIGGVSLARGYLNRPDLTAEKFIPHPFSDEPGARLYKTGDLARFLPDGNIEFLGRIDHQVKVRGFRIELGEIETVLEGHPALSQAVVLAREDNPGDKRLVAYIVPQQGESPATGELRNFTQQKLPAYMVPSTFVTLDALPLTPNAKIDRRALPPPEGTRPDSEKTVPPRDALELQLARIWEEILDIRPISVKDNFFDLGGHSLLAVRLIAQIQQQLGQDLSLVTLFQEPTVEHLASILRQQGSTDSSSLVPLQPKGSKPPLFFVHPSGGSVHWYADLARYLGSEQPFYGLQAQGLNGDQTIHTTIEDMASHYVSVLREFHPQGPYLLGSWSMGVIVAFEMARRLQAQGQKVALLALLDQGPTLPAKEPKDDADYLMDVFGKHLPLSLDHLQQLEPGEQVAYVWHEARKANWIYPDITLAQFSHFVHMLRTHTEAWRRYVPRIYPGRITLFRARKQPQEGHPDPDLGWAKLAAGGVDIHKVPGDHLSMIHKRHARTLAKRLTTCIDEIQAGG